MRKSFRTVSAVTCFGLLTLFFFFAHFIMYPSASSFDGWLSMTFLIAILFGTQSLMHLFITRMQIPHPLAWQLFSVMACVLAWIYLFLHTCSPDITTPELLLVLFKSFVGLLTAHGVVLGDYLLTKHFLSQE